ncbi:serine/threonine protein kinase [Lujinxingia sediminis]|uniref:Serine/threonine protein kinase n=2 Tax=Lujinxingia sediminis TaxID=2480984 RepID=A0ABY0CS11_9DELT|nr:serine/threonine protein kinase [Lujinxingia sediminis]
MVVGSTMSETIAEAEASAICPGDELAGRYVLGHRLGTGGFGAVYAARDRLLDEQVAVKILDTREPVIEQRHVWREAAILRVLDVPGVVQLRDEGIHQGRYFLVMNYIDGRPFPGAGVYGWEGLAVRVRSLLKVLALVHSQGVVHGDLKPGNVLVDEAGRVTLLDFGVASSQGLSVQAGGVVRGTPVYLAPEQWRGEAPSPQSDLYSVGVMIYEALVGQRPYQADSVSKLMKAVLLEPLPAWEPRVRGVPDEVEALVYRLLARFAERRPASAQHALSMFAAGRQRYQEVEWPMLGRESAFAKVELAIEQRQPIDVAGPPGSGRSRLLDAIEEIYRARGDRPVLRVVSGSRPLESLWAFGTSDVQSAGGFEEVSALAKQRVGEVLQAGGVVLVDDLEQVDRWSRKVLDAARSLGAMVRAVKPHQAAAPRVELGDLTPVQLQGLFVGHEEVFRLRSGGAYELWRRTLGRPARVAQELDDWIRVGVARAVGARVQLEPAALGRLRAGTRVSAQREELAAPLPPRGPRRDLLAWLSLAHPLREAPVLAELMKRPLWEVEAEIEVLVQEGLLPEERQSDVIVPLFDALFADWKLDDRRDAHKKIAGALPAGHPQRFFHLVQAGESAHAAEEACLRAQNLDRDGELGRAIALLEEGWAALRLSPDERGPQRDRLLLTWAKIALSNGSPRELERFLAAMERAGEPDAHRRSIEKLVRAAILSMQVQGPTALATMDEVAPLDDPELELRRQRFRLQASWGCEREVGQRVMAEIEAWASGHSCGEIQGTVRGWMGLMFYRQARFEDAARLHTEAARLKTRVSARLSSALNAATSLLECGELESAEHLILKARTLAERRHQPVYVVRSRILQRRLDYRRDHPGAPDEAFIAASRELALPELDGLLGLVEAAMAFRMNEHETARTMAMASYQAWSRTGNVWGAKLALALAVRCGRQVDWIELAELMESATTCHLTSIGAQIVGLLVPVVDGVPDEAQRYVRQLADTLTPEQLRARREVLSVQEALDALNLEC